MDYFKSVEFCLGCGKPTVEDCGCPAGTGLVLRKVNAVLRKVDVVEEIVSFTGVHFFLSNFYFTKIEFEDKLYPSIKHTYQTTKTLNQDEREQVRLCKSAGDAKRMGQKVTMREGWDNLKIPTMRQLLYKKFETGSELFNLLQRTGEATLAEGNWWGDQFWGICNGVGDNHLGKLLMEIRDGKGYR